MRGRPRHGASSLRGSAGGEGRTRWAGDPSRRLVAGSLASALAAALVFGGVVLVFADAHARLDAAMRIAVQAEILDEAPVRAEPTVVARTVLIDSISLDGPMPHHSVVIVDSAGYRTTIDDPDALVFVDGGGYQYVSYGSFGGMGTGSPVPLPRPWIPRLVSGVLATGLALAIGTAAALALTWPGTARRGRFRARGRRERPLAS